jgi:cytochrome P450
MARHVMLPPLRRQPISRELRALFSIYHCMLTKVYRWGFGKHACPGRFYSIKLAKLVFMVLLTEFEFQADGEPLSQHPPSFEVEGQFLPNLQQKIQIRARHME